MRDFFQCLTLEKVFKVQNRNRNLTVPSLPFLNSFLTYWFKCILYSYTTDFESALDVLRIRSLRTDDNYLWPYLYCKLTLL